MIAEACSAAPEGRQHRTQQLLAHRVVALGLAESYSYHPGDAPARRYDYQNERRGTRNLSLFLEPQTGWRHLGIASERYPGHH
ncbi:transposase [Methylocaldum marinum]|uniref:Transposase n=1 Tax=Methylocaldum marinum TaxID=1432792 RepID=A0A250KVX8_9GAMM|nr:hypothetical protein [Methylocaldum marinum]BBA35767.1 transposase [Methylocaldum marinum]